MEGVDEGTRDSLPEERDNGGSRSMEPRKEKGRSEADSGGVPLHSERIGGATKLAAGGASDAVVQ